MEDRGVTIWAFDQCQHDYEIQCRNLMMRQLIENHAALTDNFPFSLHIVFGLRLHRAELDLLAVTPYGVFIGDLKEVYGRLRGKMNGRWYVEAKGKISPIRRNENPWEQLRRYRGQVTKELQNFTNSEAFIGSNRDDCCKAGLVQVPALDLVTNIEDRWWYQCGVGEWIPFLLNQNGQTIIDIPSVVGWLKSLGCESQSLRDVAKQIGVLRLPHKQEQKSDLDSGHQLEMLTTELDEHQRDAVFRSGKEPFVILAGPGAGKTSVVVERSRQFKKRIQKNEWLAVVSYTNSAVDEISYRLGEKIGNTQFGDVFVGTFHRFAIEVINRSKNFDSPTTMLDERASVWRYSCFFGINESHAKFDLRAISSSKLEDLTEDIRTRWACFMSHLRRQKVAIFESLLHELLEVIKSEPEALPKILVYDEFQDVSPTQGQLVKKMVDAGVEVTVVGDPEQSIFGFNGCSPESLISFAQESGSRNVAKLATNYRSEEKIVNLSAKLRKTAGFDLNIQSSRPVGQGHIDLVGFSSDRAQFAYVSNWVHNLKEKFEISYEDIAILFRDWNSLPLLQKSLEEKAIPYNTLDNRSHTPRPLRQLAALSFISYRIDNPEALFTLLQTLPRISAGLVRKFLELESVGISYKLTTIHDSKNQIDCRYHEEIDSIHNVVQIALARRNEPASGEIRWLWDNVVRKAMTREEFRRVDEFDSTVGMWCDYLDLRPEITHRELCDSVSKLDKLDEVSDSVHIGTIHTAKGRQWKAVVVVDICDDSFVRKGCDLNEEIRLLHVACSRPTNWLLLGFPKRRGIASDGGVIRSLFEKCTNQRVMDSFEDKN